MKTTNHFKAAATKKATKDKRPEEITTDDYAPDPGSELEGQNGQKSGGGATKAFPLSSEVKPEQDDEAAVD